MALKRVKMTKCSSKDFPRLLPSSRVAAHPTYNPKIKGSNTATGSGREKVSKNISKESVRLYPSSTVAAHSTHDPKIKGPNATTGTGRGKMVKGENFLGTPLHIRGGTLSPKIKVWNLANGTEESEDDKMFK
jgi:hypothetical protein